MNGPSPADATLKVTVLLRQPPCDLDPWCQYDITVSQGPVPVTGALHSLTPLGPGAKAVTIPKGGWWGERREGGVKQGFAN